MPQILRAEYLRDIITIFVYKTPLYGLWVHPTSITSGEEKTKSKKMWTRMNFPIEIINIIMYNNIDIFIPTDKVRLPLCATSMLCWR